MRKLRQAKFRKEFGLFIAEGDKLVAEFLKGPFVLQEIYCTKEWADNYNALIQCELIIVNQKELSQISGLTAANQVLATIQIPKEELSLAKFSGMTLLLDGIRDPGNLGTIIRTADWFGINSIIASEDTVETWNPKVVQSTMGSLNRVEILRKDLVDFLKDHHGSISIVGSFMDGQSLYDQSLPKDLFLVIGNEANGISSEFQEFIDQRIGIPSSGISGAESLNAAISCSIFCAEYRRLFP